MNKSEDTLEKPGAVLLDHAEELGKTIPSTLDAIMSFWPDVHEQIRVGIEASRHSRTKILFKAIQGQHEQVVASSKQLTDDNVRLLATYKSADLKPRIQDIRVLNRTVDQQSLLMRSSLGIVTVVWTSCSLHLISGRS